MQPRAKPLRENLPLLLQKLANTTKLLGLRPLMTLRRSAKLVAGEERKELADDDRQQSTAGKRSDKPVFTLVLSQKALRLRRGSQRNQELVLERQLVEGR